MTSKELSEFGQRVRNIRKQLRISQKELAQHLNISNTYLSEIEAGRFKPGFHFFGNLVTKFNVNIKYLITGQGDSFINTETTRKHDYGEYSERIQEMLKDFEQVPMVKYAMLEFYENYKITKKAIIEAARKEYLEKKQPPAVK